MKTQSIAIESILSRVSKADIRRDPFPHIAVPNVLGDELYQALASTMPTAEHISEKIGKPIVSNERYNYMSEHILHDDSLPRVWKDFVTYHSSAEFYHEFLDLFHDDLMAANPDVEDKYGPLHKLRVGRRNHDTFDTHDILMDCTAVINSPVVGKPTSYRGPHVDKPYKLFGGLFYMRLPEDDSTGGDLELYRYRSDEHKFHASRSEYGDSRFDIDPKYVVEVDTITYASNVLVMYPINRYALHGVSVRSVTPHQRRFVALVGDMPDMLFDLDM